MGQVLANKHIVLGITGSIAAYKSCQLIRLFVKAGAEVQVVITPAGREFITPITLSALTHKPVISEFFSQRDGSWNSHVDLGLWADAMVIAPATASTIGKMVHGVADNMLITTYLSMKAPVFLAPAMDLDMYRHPSTRQNLQTLRAWNTHIVEPECGELASGLVGKGRMAEPEQIFAAVRDSLVAEGSSPTAGPLKDKTVIVTAGPTRESIDAVRYISNYSSGKMGFALAESLAKAGAHVELVAGPVALQVNHPLIRRHDVVTADEMLAVCLNLFPKADAAILCAAVADYKAAHAVAHKIKREETGAFSLQLVPNPDIAKALGQLKSPAQRLIGFALETDNEEANALAKLERKHMDYIVLNSLRDAGSGFGVDTNKVTILSATGQKYHFPLKNKTEVADDIVEVLATSFGE